MYHTSWAPLLEEDTCKRMLDVIISLLGEEARLAHTHFNLELGKVRCVLVGRVTREGLARHTSLTSNWMHEGVLLFQYPPHPVRDRSMAIWEGWIRQLLINLSRRKSTQHIVFGLFGRPVWGLKRSITQPCECFPATDARDYKTCALAALSKLVVPDATKIIW